MVNAVASVSWWLNNRRKPSYVHDKFGRLEYRIGNDTYEIYNPQRFKFDIDSFKARLVMYHRSIGEGEAHSFNVVQGS